MIRQAFDYDNMFKALFANELSSNHKLATKLSFAGNKNSGISFGYQQMDTKHNTEAIKVLMKIGFTNSDFELIKKFNKISTKTYYKKWRFTNKEQIKAMEEKLRNNKDYLFELSKIKIRQYVDYILDDIKLDVVLEDFTVLAHLVDYHNQFHFSFNGKIHKWIKELGSGALLTSKMVIDFKMQTLWGKTKVGSKDLERRHHNISKFNYYSQAKLIEDKKLKVYGRG